MTTTVAALPRTPALLVQQAARALRAGRPVTVVADDVGLRVAAAEAVVETTEEAGPGDDAAAAALVLSGQRVASVTGRGGERAAWRVPLPGGAPVGVVRALADPTSPLEAAATAWLGRAEPAGAREEAAVELCKLAGLLPAAVVTAVPAGGSPAGVRVPAAAIVGYRRLEGLGLRPVSEAVVPLLDAEEARVVAFRPADGGPEQLAILVGEPENRAAPLCRMHSECFTGDLLGSLRCDCGEQLRGAIRRMAEEGAGVLLYLAQEGRGIGLANKLRAYALQDGGLDTVDANTHLGFEPDEREYHAAAAMLRHLGLGRVRLLTNNPAKLRQLAACGIEVAGRVAHSFAANDHNRGYLRTKALRSGHLLPPDEPAAAVANGSDGAGGGGTRYARR